ncbi:MAG: CsbD family protein [Actinobacteria bacterium]|nr:CsbD family protein [Actinomycetota bacterium]
MADLEDVKGRVKEAAGSLFGDKSKKNEGRAQQAKADAQEKAAESQQKAAEAEAVQRRSQ